MWRCTPTTARKPKLDGFMRPLIAISQERVNNGQPPLFQSHMWDGSAVELEENLSIADELLEACAKAKIIMELEIGVVGGEEDGVVGAMNEKLYTSPKDMQRVADVLGLGERGRYMLAATFGNVHGVYKPGHVQLRPAILKEGQEYVGERGRQARSRSTWSSTAAAARRWRRSARRSTTASSR